MNCLLFVFLYIFLILIYFWCFHRKRKSDAKTKAPAVKKIKREPGVSCSICEERFDKIMFREIHMAAYHQPAIVEYGCSSCHDQFQTTEENTEHHEWHQQFNVPYKCVVCSVTFDKLIAFQRHLLACMHPSYASITTFSKSFYCDLCNTDFETQNLYDWHDCLIGNNSPCPICQRVFIKKTVLMKHIFKCTGPAGAASESPKKVGRPKKKKKEPYKNRLEIPPQNSFKLEPETIIEQNMDVDDGYEAIDNSFMDSHFGDSDGFDENDSIITPAQPVEETQPPLIQEAMEANASQTNIGGGGGSSSDASDLTGTSVRTNLNRPLLECRVKLEPIDVSSFTNVTASTTASDLSFEKTAAVVPPLIISRPALTVPPLTIRIKKEVIQPGYGDEFDANLAKNIKQEKSDEIWELASNHKKSKEQEKQKKLYKKPALLAIKIKQEKMDRETNDDEQYNDVYDNFSIPLDNLCETSVNQNPYENSSLPIITQIHSVIDSPTINQPNTMIPAVTSSLVHNVPFVPIRIKSEFHKPTTPPLINHFDECSSNKTVTTITTASPASIPENIESISTEDDQHGSEIDRQTQITECDSSVLPSESEPMDSQSCEDTSKIINIAETSIGARSDETLTTGTDDIVQNNDETVADSNENQLIAAKQLSEKVDDNVQNENEISSQKQDETHEQIHEHEKCQKIETNKQPVVATIMDFSTEIDENVNSQHSMELNKEIGNNLSDEQTAADEESEQVGNVIKPICEDDDRNSILDAEVTNASISPIDFSESNANDDSLNFIDQLVHEVADTMVPAMPNDNEPESTIQIQNVPDDSSIGRFDEGNFAFATGCPIEVAGGPNENIELNAVDIAAKDSTTDSTNLLTMPDMPDIDYNDLLPVLNSTEVKSNGTEVITNLPVDNDATNDAQMANLAESNAVDEVIQPKISVFENTTNEPNCNSNTSNESL